MLQNKYNVRRLPVINIHAFRIVGIMFSHQVGCQSLLINVVKKTFLLRNSNTAINGISGLSTHEKENTTWPCPFEAGYQNLNYFILFSGQRIIRNDVSSILWS